jgi:hypothetical protein
MMNRDSMASILRFLLWSVLLTASPVCAERRNASCGECDGFSPFFHDRQEDIDA